MAGHAESRVELKCERNGQTLALRCKVISPKTSLPNGLSTFSIELSKLLGISVSLNNAADNRPEYLVYLPPCRGAWLCQSWKAPVDEAVLEEAWSGLLVSVHVVLCTEAGDIRSSLRALGPRGAVLGHTSDPTISLVRSKVRCWSFVFQSSVIVRRVHYFIGETGEWALLWRNAKQREHACLE